MHLLAKIFISVPLLFSTCFVRQEVKTDQTEVDTETIRTTEKEPRDERENTRASSDEKPTIKVVGVNDGDTITVFDEENNKQFKIRLATIDAPEYTQAFGKKSRQHLSDLVFNKRILINSYGKDRYGRLIGEVFVEGKNINVAQIKNGYAWHYKRHQKQQTIKQRLIYSRAQDEAKDKRLGIWQYDNPVPPWAYRKKSPRNQKIEKFRKSEN